MNDLNGSNNSDEMNSEQLVPSLQQVESMAASIEVISTIQKNAALKLYRKYLHSRVPEFLAKWYLANYELLGEVMKLD